MNFKNLKLLIMLIFSVGVILPVQADKIVATVNKDPILQSQVDALLRGKKTITADERRAALERLVDQSVLKQSASKIKVTVSKAEIDQAVNNIIAQNDLTYGEFLDALDDENITMETFRSNIARQIQEVRVREAFVQDAIEIKPEEVKELAKKLQSESKYKEPPKTKEYQISHILIKVTPLVSDKQAQSELERTLANISKGTTDFATEAKKISKDYYSGSKGGDLGWAILHVYDKTFAKVASSTKIGQISKPFKTKFGWHILRVDGTRDIAGDNENFYMNKAYGELYQQRSQEVDKDMLKILRKQSSIIYY